MPLYPIITRKYLGCERLKRLCVILFRNAYTYSSYGNKIGWFLTWGNMFLLYLLFIKTRTNIILLVMIPMERPSKHVNLIAFSNAMRVDGISKLFHTLSLLHDTFHTGVGRIITSFGMILFYSLQNNWSNWEKFSKHQNNVTEKFIWLFRIINSFYISKMVNRIPKALYGTQIHIIYGVLNI